MRIYAKICHRQQRQVPIQGHHHRIQRAWLPNTRFTPQFLWVHDDLQWQQRRRMDRISPIRRPSTCRSPKRHILRAEKTRIQRGCWRCHRKWERWKWLQLSQATRSGFRMQQRQSPLLHPIRPQFAFTRKDRPRDQLSPSPGRWFRENRHRRWPHEQQPRWQWHPLHEHLWFYDERTVTLPKSAHTLLSKSGKITTFCH